MDKPLSGYRVVELGTHVAVPIASRMMADWGAEVIKVEPPRGEPWRTIGNSYGVPCTKEHNPLFQNENANKKDIVLNLKIESGHEAFLKLLETADIFLTNTRPKALKKLGIDYESLSQRYPRLIYGHFSGFGALGPDKDRPGFDVAAFWAKSGIPVEWSTREHPPFKPQAGFGDSISGSLLLSGLLAALLGREKTGRGDFLQISLYGSALWCNNTGVVCTQPQYGLHYPKGKEDFTSPYAPLYCTKDGDWITWSLPDWDTRYKDVLVALKLEEYLDDPRFSTLAGTRNYILELIDIFTAAFAKLTTEEVVTRLTEGGFVFERLIRPEEVCSDEQAWVNHYLRRVTLEDGREVALAENPVQFSSFQTEFSLAPQLGENTRDVLYSIGYNEEAVENLLGEGAALQS